MTMKDKLAEGQTRIDQHTALHWVWMLLRDNSKKKVIARIEGMLDELSNGTNVDFDNLIMGIRRCE